MKDPDQNNGITCPLCLETGGKTSILCISVIHWLSWAEPVSAIHVDIHHWMLTDENNENIKNRSLPCCKREWNITNRLPRSRFKISIARGFSPKSPGGCFYMFAAWTKFQRGCEFNHVLIHPLYRRIILGKSITKRGERCSWHRRIASHYRSLQERSNTQRHSEQH